ncbi:hypothetical protein [Paenibacillus herberti]|uniref:Uncharacterized protein n=1 Tax=Paenibacillus herberti TaxID=1619309 RepID=A0A229NSX3_9BACL|nr:hypothetical protein [Paenibacillus herberti]OXM12983.1 hypothetical protein CGZ75_24225 [Paenibacillus herberti]
MEEVKTVLIKITRPTLSNIIFGVVMMLTIIIWSQSNNYYYLFVIFLYVPWIIYTIKELKNRELSFTDNQLNVDDFTLHYKDIESVIVHKKRLDITVKNERRLTKLIYLDFKNAQDKENIKNKIDEWKTHNSSSERQ